MYIIAIIGLIILAGLSVFQVLLIVGKPLGEYAWGGQHKVLPRNLRIASISSLVLYIIFAIVLSAHSGIIDIGLDIFVDIAMWVLTAYFLVGVLMKTVSRNPKERLVMTPIALLLTIVYLIGSLNVG